MCVVRLIDTINHLGGRWNLTENFSELGLSDKVTDAVTQAGYTKPTEIQAQAIPYIVHKQDVVGIAQTGTGKTASFVLPMLTLLEKGRARARMPRTLILEPTRELAAQVYENFEKYGINHRLNVALLIGGVSFEEQNKKLDRGADVLIATPGRLIDHFERGRILMNGVEVLVIDEADRMLDMGFIPDIERIIGLLPPRRQTLFFSATMPPEVEKLTGRFLKDPIRVETARQNSTADTIVQRLLKSGNKPAEKRDTLREEIRRSENLTNAIIFCNRKRDVATVARSLSRHGFNAGALHGDMDQKARSETLEAFKNNELTLLVASDVAARGLDIPAVSHVFNFDVPTHAEDYVHRIGRTGRAGRSGHAATIVSPADQKYIDAICKLIEKDIEWAEPEKTQDKSDPKQADTTSNAPADKVDEPTEGKKRSPRRRQARRKSNDEDVVVADSAETESKPNPRKSDQSTPVVYEVEPREKYRNSAFGKDGPIPAFLLIPAIRLSKSTTSE